MSKLMLAYLNDVVFLDAVMQPTNYDGKPGVKYELDLRSLDGLISVLCTEDAYKQALDIPDYSKVCCGFFLFPDLGNFHEFCYIHDD